MDVSKNLTDVYSKIDLRLKNLGNISFVQIGGCSACKSPRGKWSKVELE